MVNKIKLRNLHCIDCANEIEDRLREAGYKLAIVNFTLGEVMVDGDIDRAKRIIREVDPAVDIVGEETYELDEEEDGDRLPLHILSILVFGIGIILYYFIGYRDPPVITLFLAPYLVSGYRVLVNAFKSLIYSRAINEYILISIATLGAYIIGEYPEGTAVMLFFVVGEYLEDRMVHKSRRSIKSLLLMRPTYAYKKSDGGIERVRPDDLSPGDMIVLRPGDKVPVDGVVVNGIADVDTSSLTGESIPRSIGPGEEIQSGMINLNGYLEVRVLRRYSESTIARVMEIIERSVALKAETEKFITRFSRIYTPIVILLAILVAVAPPLFLGGDPLKWVYRGLVLLVIACPCALALSVPVSYFVSLGRLAREGILVKGSKFIDILSKVNIVAFDKTGTLTKGCLRVLRVRPYNNYDGETVLRYAAIAESRSSHPIARAILEAVRDVDDDIVTDYREYPGLGVVAETRIGRIYVGNDRLLHRYNIEHPICDTGYTVIHVALDGKYLGYITFTDEVKEDASETIRELRSLGLREIIMLTGDTRRIAEEIASRLEVDTVYPELSPEDKVEVISKYRGGGDNKILFVGDGINDAPVISASDVGMALGALGSHLAIESSDIVVMSEKLGKIPRALRISRQARRIVKQNIIFPITVKTLFIILGSMGLANMWEAVFADVGTAIITLLNSMRIIK